MTGSGTTTGPTLDQRRARHAWEAVQSIAATKSKGDYIGEAKKLPARIMAAGLGPALAFIKAKAAKTKPALEQLHEDLTDWVIKQRPMAAPAPKSLLESIVKGDTNFLRRATDETLAYLQWLNRFAESEARDEGVET